LLVYGIWTNDLAPVLGHRSCAPHEGSPSSTVCQSLSMQASCTADTVCSLALSAGGARSHTRCLEPRCHERQVHLRPTHTPMAGSMHRHLNRMTARAPAFSTRCHLASRHGVSPHSDSRIPTQMIQWRRSAAQFTGVPKVDTDAAAKGPSLKELQAMFMAHQVWHLLCHLLHSSPVPWSTRPPDAGREVCQ
jgi:hypothetical protein